MTPETTQTSAPRDTARMSDEAVRDEVVRRYRTQGVVMGTYVRLRFLLAPLLETAHLVPEEGDVLDLGCGNGMFAQILISREPARRIMGVDSNARRIEVANEVASGSNASFVAGRAEEIDWKGTSIVTIIDLLHHMPIANQDQMLRDVCERLVPGGTILIKDLRREGTWKYWLHFVQDSLSYRERLYFRTPEEIRDLVEGAGLTVTTVDLSKGRPHPHVAYLCRK